LLVRNRHRVRPIRRTDLAQRARDVTLHGGERDAQMGRDLLIRPALRHPAQHVALPRCQPESTRYLLVNPSLSSLSLFFWGAGTVGAHDATARRSRSRCVRAVVHGTHRHE